MKLVVTGSIAYDYIMAFPGQFYEHFIAEKLENISVSFLVDSLKRMPGGTAPNIAYTLAMLGGQPRVLGTAGHDFEEHRELLEQYGVDTSGIMTIPDEFTASFFANIDQKQNQIGFFYTGAMAHARNVTFGQYAPDADLAIVSPNDPDAMRAYVAECKKLGIAYIYDPSQQTIRLSAEDLRAGIDGAAMVTVNEYELGMIEEKTGLDQNDILARAGALLVTAGEDGSTIFADGKAYSIPVAPPMRIAEPTGAGDAFRAGLMRGLQLSLPWEITGRIGALAATYVLENVGTQTHRFTPVEFVARFRQHFDDEGALDALLTHSSPMEN
jgi:adenosine kinase